MAGSPGPAVSPGSLRTFFDGAFAEHWDVLEEEATENQSKSGTHVGDCFPH
jgi:hypothetical protein